MHSVPTIETERLLLRPYRRDDFSSYCALFGNEDVTRYAGGMDFLTAIVHLAIFWIANALLTPLILLIGLFTDRGRLLHDLLIGTVAVRRDMY